MENCSDFLDYLGPDISIKVLTYIDDPSDLVHMTSVSRFWRQFTIENGFCKKLCIRMFPEVLCFKSVIEERNLKAPIRSSNSVEWEGLERDHRVYARLAQSLASRRTKRDCIQKAISASSTDNYPEESIAHTLEPSNEVKGRPSYWSSEGKDDPNLPETLTYKLKSKLCVVNEIKIQPFEAFFQYGHPIYSAKAVRFRMGHSKSPLDMKSPIANDSVDDQKSPDNNYIWTYVSPEFPMVQENCLQTFKLPQPVLCIGGILRIELLGRIQKQEMDGLYYICLPTAYPPHLDQTVPPSICRSCEN
ncbi:F-box protein At4g00755-like isoform X2 [Magnolia sinica]|uniref:F-box protein At4g00755-like isoform X2 n=1 Tax=Magnolia sinica TaxID=86752 RepID=UPI0026585D50|nr:F-box protein At4g00755-like isoform X2 [Magnolia sinica]